jgi:hypothetical protein
MATEISDPWIQSRAGIIIALRLLGMARSFFIFRFTHLYEQPGQLLERFRYQDPRVDDILIHILTLFFYFCFCGHLITRDNGQSVCGGPCSVVLHEAPSLLHRSPGLTASATSPLLCYPQVDNLAPAAQRGRRITRSITCVRF